MTQFIQAVWTYILATWTICNKHLHTDAGNLSLANYQQAVQTLYERGAQLPPAVQEALFRWALQQMLELPPAILSLQIEHAHKYMQQQSKAAQTQAQLHTPGICSFFGLTHESANDLHLP